MMSETEAPFKALIEHLVKAQYSFVCPSPETQTRVVHKRTSNALTKNAKTAEDVFGWNLPVTQ
jgi:hypothetical protein